MKAYRKLRNNILTRNALSVLGPVQYAQYLMRSIRHVRAVIHSGDLRPVDEVMGVSVDKFRYQDSQFVFDCRFCDQHIRDGSFAFGIVREICIRNCYFKHHPPDVYIGARTVVDLGANRGVFSVLMACRGGYVLSVEALRSFEPVIRHNMKQNGYTNYAIEVGFVGRGGSLSNPHSACLTMQELLKRHSLDRVDLIKMDIEGSEFALFDSPEWLHCVNAISMEVHPAFGDPMIILESLKRHGFGFAIADEDLRCVSDTRSASFIYAWRHR